MPYLQLIFANLT